MAAVMGTGANAQTLYVTGTAGNDLLSLAYHSKYLRVRLNGGLQQFLAHSINRIEIQALDGNDIVDWSSIAINTYCDGGAGNDAIYGGSGNDSISGSAGKDTIYGGAGDDRIDGGKHNDVIYGGDGNDVIYGNEGNNYLDGGNGKDHIFGDVGNNTLIGDAGNDALYGGDGNDSIVGGAGADILSGGAGNDTINASGDDTADIVDGGAGTDTVLSDSVDTVTTAEIINGVDTTTPTPPTSPGNGTTGSTVGSDGVADLDFSDEGLWDSHFASTEATMKSLGVKTVRLFLNINSFAERPSTSDTIDYNALVQAWSPGYTGTRPVVGGLAMKRAFQLKDDGFNIVMTVSEYGGAPPASTDQVRQFFTYLMNAPESSTSTRTLKDVVDYWEVGNEPDLVSNWTPSGTNKTTGLQEYVDDELEPAADVLHAAGEKVISAGVSYSANDLETIIKEIQKDNFMSEVDALGYHPYGSYDPATSSVNQIAQDTAQAVKFANAVDRPLIATEWNVRGYPADGSRNAAWASAIATIYQTVIKPSFALDFYYQLVDNYATRGGNPSARPSGLLEHDGSAPATTTSSVSDLLAYYNSPLIDNAPFYSTFAGFNS